MQQSIKAEKDLERSEDHQNAILRWVVGLLIVQTGVILTVWKSRSKKPRPSIPCNFLHLQSKLADSPQTESQKI